MRAKVVTGFLLATLVSCGGGGGDEGQPNNPTQPGNPSNPMTPTTPTTPTNSATVSVQDNQYAPESVNITTGGTVTWNWASGNYASHSVTFADGNGSSPAQLSGTHSRTFTTAGSYAYSCSVHGQGMSGTVVVTAPSNP